MIRQTLFNHYRKLACQSVFSVNLADLIVNPKLISNSPGVYLIYNLQTYEPYVGESYHVAHRLIQHATSNPATQQIDRVIQKLGANHFAVAFLQWSPDIKPRRKLEKQYVQLFNAYDNGYNGSKDGHPKTELQRIIARKGRKIKRKLGGKNYLYHRKYRGWLQLARFAYYQRNNK